MNRNLGIGIGAGLAIAALFLLTKLLAGNPLRPLIKLSRKGRTGLKGTITK